eukprot:854873-Pyramimonas_sp.AAC.1
MLPAISDQMLVRLFTCAGRHAHQPAVPCPFTCISIPKMRYRMNKGYYVHLLMAAGSHLGRVLERADDRGTDPSVIGADPETNPEDHS